MVYSVIYGFKTLKREGKYMDITVAIVALNEEEYLPNLIEDIKKQTYEHSKIEILFIDSMSSDSTPQIMQAFIDENQKSDKGFKCIKKYKNTGGIQASGWNQAIKHFSTDALIRIDAHSHIPEDFVEKNVKILESGEDVCGGVRPTLCQGDSAWARTLLMAEESMFGSSIASYRRQAKKTYVKSLFHAAYKREVLEKVGGFREDLGRTEDNEFHYRITSSGFKICMSDEIISYQYIRPTFRKMCKQKFGNGYWIGITSKICPACLSLYHFVPAVFILGILITTIFALLKFPFLAILMWSLYGLLAISMTIISMMKNKFHISELLLPFLFLILHLAYGIGTWIGVVKNGRN